MKTTFISMSMDYDSIKILLNKIISLPLSIRGKGLKTEDKLKRKICIYIHNEIMDFS